MYFYIFYVSKERKRENERTGHLKHTETHCHGCGSAKGRCSSSVEALAAVRHALRRFSTSHLATDLWTATWPRYGRYTSVHPRAAISTATGSPTTPGVLLSLGCETRFRAVFSGTLVLFSLSRLRLSPRGRAQILIIVQEVRGAALVRTTLKWRFRTWVTNRERFRGR